METGRRDDLFTASGCVLYSSDGQAWQDLAETERVMTYWLTEDAFMPMLIGIFMATILLLMAWSARNKIVFFAALLVAALTAGVVVTEAAIVTDREQVTDLVYELARHVRANDADEIARHISPDAPEIATRMRGQMERFEVLSCSIAGVNDFSAEDGKATIDFVAWGQGKVRRGGFESAANPRVELELQKQPDESWKIIGYAISNPRSGISL